MVHLGILYVKGDCRVIRDSQLEGIAGSVDAEAPACIATTVDRSDRCRSRHWMHLIVTRDTEYAPPYRPIAPLHNSHS
jgi:hypothetical protein